MLVVVGVLLTLVCIGGLWALRMHRIDQEDCVNNMRQLYGAAVSYCLVERLSPTSVLSVSTLSPYLKSGTVCPAGQSAYPPFSVLNGPICPNGHEFEPGLSRPIRAASYDRKLAGVYLAHGFTNLIDRTEPNGPADGSQPVRSETNRASSAAGSRR